MTTPPLILRERLLSGAVRARVEELVRTDARVRALAMILGPRKLFEWALSVGTLEDPVLGRLSPPLPDKALRSITADDEPEMFLWTGLSDVHAFLELLERHLQPPAEARALRILDFGCGCGRLLRFLRAAEGLELHGVDVNREHIEWCRAHLAPIAFVHSEVEPPLPFAARTFDALWSLSVFTHLDEAAGRAWRAELARIMAPGAILIATVQGETSLARAASDPELARRIGWNLAHVERAREMLSRAGHGFMRYESESLTAAQAGENYGLHYATEAHLRRTWPGEHFEVLDYQAGGLRGWQDIVVLKRR